MRIERVNRATYNTLCITRTGGSRAEAPVSKKGPLRHDGTRVAVEQGLGVRRGFFSLLAEGRRPGEVAGLTSADQAAQPQMISASPRRGDFSWQKQTGIAVGIEAVALTDRVRISRLHHICSHECADEHEQA